MINMRNSQRAADMIVLLLEEETILNCRKKKDLVLSHKQNAKKVRVNIQGL